MESSIFTHYKPGRSIGEAGGVNLYGYVSNNPLNTFDPEWLYDFRDGDKEEYRDLIGVPEKDYQDMVAARKKALEDFKRLKNNADDAAKVCPPILNPTPAGWAWKLIEEFVKKPIMDEYVKPFLKSKKRSVQDERLLNKRMGGDENSTRK